MYLVLTAMLALNVSADIINGFAKLRHSMESSMEATYNRTQKIMETFEYEYNKDEASKAKYGDWYEVAKAMYQKSEEFYEYIEKFKLDIARDVDGENYEKMPETIKGGPDTNKPHAYAFNMTDPETGRTNAEELKFRMQDYVEYMSNPTSQCILDRMNQPKFRSEIEQKTAMVRALFNTDDVVNEEFETIKWEASVFHEMPAAAVLAMLVKYQNDINTVEFDMINFMFAQTSASTFIANAVEALVLPTNGEYIMQGQQYRAKIVSAMMDTNQVPRVFIGNQEIFGGVYTASATSPGEHTYRGYMLIGDDTTHYEFKGQYTVGVPSATISNTELNIMYRGYDNPFSISVPGASSDKVKVECAGAKVTKKDNTWVIVPQGNADIMNIDVYAEIEGKMTKMGSQPFRIKTLPKPNAYISFGDEVTEDFKLSPDKLTRPSTKIVASYGKDGLVQAKFSITGFQVKLPNGSTYNIKGDKMDAKTIASINKLSKGSTVNFMYIKAKGPDGAEVTLRPLTIELN